MYSIVKKPRLITVESYARRNFAYNEYDWQGHADAHRNTRDFHQVVYEGLRLFLFKDASNSVRRGFAEGGHHP